VLPSFRRPYRTEGAPCPSRQAAAGPGPHRRGALVGQEGEASGVARRLLQPPPLTCTALVVVAVRCASCEQPHAVPSPTSPARCPPGRGAGQDRVPRNRRYWSSRSCGGSLSSLLHDRRAGGRPGFNSAESSRDPGPACRTAALYVRARGPSLTGHAAGRFRCRSHVTRNRHLPPGGRPAMSPSRRPLAEHGATLERASTATCRARRRPARRMLRANRPRRGDLPRTGSPFVCRGGARSSQTCRWERLLPVKSR
jgi:hypothetical protein